MAFTDLDAKGAAGWSTGRPLVNLFSAIAANFLALKPLVPNVVSSAAANYVLALGVTFVRATKADAAQTVTVPANATTAHPIGTEILVEADTAQAVTIAAAATVTVRRIATKTLVIAGQYGVARLTKVGTNEWIASGDLTAV